MASRDELLAITSEKVMDDGACYGHRETHQGDHNHLSCWAEDQAMSKNENFESDIIPFAPYVPPTASFWSSYWSIQKDIWLSPWLWVFLASTFVVGMGGKVNHPERVIPGILFLVMFFFPALGLAIYKLEQIRRSNR